MLIEGIPKPNQLDPKCQNDLRIVETTKSEALAKVHIFFRNTTPYTLHLDYIHCHLYHDHTLIGEGWISNTSANPKSRPGASANFKLQPFIRPTSKDSIISLATKYICGKKSEIEIRLHDKSIPSMPELSHILSRTFFLNVVLPKLSPDQTGNTILEANEPASDRSEKFISEEGKVGSPNCGLESPIIYGAEMHITSSKVQLTLFNPFNIPIHISRLSGRGMHNEHHLGDVDVPEDWEWIFEPGVQRMPPVPVKWSLLSFGLDPTKAISMAVDGLQRGGEVSVDVQGKADIRIGELEIGEMEVSVNGIATKVCV